MRRYGLAAVLLAWVTGLTWAEGGDRKPETRDGQAHGTVVSTEAIKGDGGLLLSLTITRAEGGAQETFLVGPRNGQAYSMVGSLKAGEQVRVNWVSEGGDKKWIRSIQRIEAEGERKDGERKDGEGKKTGPKDTGGPKAEDGTRKGDRER